jgi:hypothetical protein
MQTLDAPPATDTGARRARVRALRLVATEAPDTGAARVLTTEFPTVAVELDPACGVCDAIVDCSAWLCGASFAPFDEAIARASGERISIRGPCRTIAAVGLEVLTRYQRHVDRRNDASSGPLFDAVLRAHAGLHDFGKPLVVADHDHALDTWQWLLRLEPEAPLALQLAALFHDVERLESEADRRVEHHAPDYQAFKDAHARRGGERAREVLISAGLDAATAARVGELVAVHERRAEARAGDDGAAIDLLNDADALSFFSLNSAGYADYFGPAQTRRKVAYTLGRMSPRARAKLSGVRLRPDVMHFLGECGGLALEGTAA